MIQKRTSLQEALLPEIRLIPGQWVEQGITILFAQESLAGMRPSRITLNKPAKRFWANLGSRWKKQARWGTYKYSFSKSTCFSTAKDAYERPSSAHSNSENDLHQSKCTCDSVSLSTDNINPDSEWRDCPNNKKASNSQHEAAGARTSSSRCI
jgi:hypothetical protein